MVGSIEHGKDVAGPEDVRHAIGTLKSLHDGDLGILEVTDCGSQAIPALRALLFERDPSGLYQVRCRAVEALAGLGAHEVLIDFLSTPREIADAIERVGEDAVVNAAARALANRNEQRVFDLLLRLAHRSCLTGVIAALGSFRRVEAIPLLVKALIDDSSRLTANQA